MAQSTSQANSHLAKFLPSKGPIQADFVTCLAPVIAEPGDRLIVLNGFCIGVDTGAPAQEPSAPATPPPLKLLPAPSKPKSRPKPKPKPAAISTVVEARKAKILSVLAERGPLRSAALSKATGFSRIQLVSAIIYLDAEHLLAIPQVRGTGHYRLYQLA